MKAFGPPQQRRYDRAVKAFEASRALPADQRDDNTFALEAAVETLMRLVEDLQGGK